MQLKFVTGQQGRQPQDAVRFLLDTNVASPFLRWMALDVQPPPPDVVDAFSWLQARCRTTAVAAALGRPRELAVDMRLAVVETSRHAGLIDGSRLALMEAAQVVLANWLASAEPISQRVDRGRPTIKARRQVAAAFDELPEDVYHLGVMTCLVRLAKLDRLRRAGDLSRPSDRLDALEEWTERVQAVEGMSSFVFLAATQTALAGDGAPARAMCKFTDYRDRAMALKTSANASWDMLFLRMLHASELGLRPYEELNGPTTLMTFDRQFAMSASGIVRAFRGSGRNDRELPGSVARLRQHLQRDVSSDPRMLDRLDEVARRARIRQQRRLDTPSSLTYSEMQAHLEEALDDLFPSPAEREPGVD